MRPSALVDRSRGDLRRWIVDAGSMLLGAVLLGAWSAQVGPTLLHAAVSAALVVWVLLLVYLAGAERSVYVFVFSWVVATTLASSDLPGADLLLTGRFVPPAVLALLAFALPRSGRVALRTPTFVGAAVLTWVALSVFGSFDPGTSLFKGAALAVGFVGVLAILALTRDDFARLGSVMTVAFGVLAVSNVLAIGVRSAGRLQGWTINPNSLGEICAFTFPLLLATAMRRGYLRQVALLCLPVVVGLLLLTGSRNAMLGAVVGAIVLLRTLRRAGRAVVAGFLIAAILVVLQVTSPSQARSVAEEEANRIDRVGEVSSGRLDRWSTGIGEIKKRPVFGAGYATTSGRNFAWSDPTNPEGGHFHNSYLEAAVETGLLGMLPLLLAGLYALSFLVRPGPALAPWAPTMAATAAVLAFFETGAATGGSILFLPFWLGVTITHRARQVQG